MAAIVAALPPVPVGGKLQNKDSVTTLGQQCKGATGDFSLEATRYYELNYRKSIVSVAINATALPATDDILSAAYGSASPKRSAGLKVIVWLAPLGALSRPSLPTICSTVSVTGPSTPGKPVPTRMGP
mgnify:CR=1 FL=1